MQLESTSVNHVLEDALSTVKVTASAMTSPSTTIEETSAGSTSGTCKPSNSLVRSAFAREHLMAGQGSMAIREIARRAGRDVRAVHSDIGIGRTLLSVLVAAIMHCIV